MDPRLPLVTMRLTRLAVITALVGGLLLTSGTPVAAECSRLDPWPSFKKAVPNAKTVFVGTVTGAPSGSGSVFTLQVDEILRGHPPVMMEFSGFKSGVPLSICPRDSTLRVRKSGDRLAFAMDALLPGTPGRIAAVAFVGDSKPNRFMNPKMEQLPLWKVRKLSGHAPDGSTVRQPRDFLAGGPLARLTIKKVEAGVWRVVDDGAGHDLRRVRYIAAGPDDAVWLADNKDLSRLGEPGDVEKPRSMRYLFDLDIAPDGSLLASGPFTASYDGESWVEFRSEPEQDDGHSHVVVASDGTLWAATTGPLGGPEGNPGYARWDGDGWTLAEHPCHCLTSGVVEATDGDMWMGVKGWFKFAGDSGAGLFRLDGETWQEVQPFDTTEPFEAYGLTTGPDGTLWVSLFPKGVGGPGNGDYSRAHLARWDGETWTAFAWPSWARRILERVNPYAGSSGFSPRFDPEMTVSPDGTLWFKRPLMSFDGETWSAYTVPTKDADGPRANDLSVAPDGLVWLVVRGYDHWVPGKPHRIYVIDPDEAVPTKTEAAAVRLEQE